MLTNVELGEECPFDRVPVTIQPGLDELGTTHQIKSVDIVRIVAEQYLIIGHLTGDIDVPMLLAIRQLPYEYLEAKGSRIYISLANPSLPCPTWITGEQQLRGNTLGTS